MDRRVQAFRAHVLACAEALFAERGIEGTKIDDVCEAADVAKRTLCNHFPTKSHLVEALAHDAVSRLVTTVDEARESGDSTRARLEGLFEALRRRAAELGPIHREFVGAFFGAAHGTAHATEGEIRVSDAIRALLAAGGPGELPPNAPIETFTEVVLGAIYSTTLEWIHRDDYDIEQRTRAIGAFLVGLLPNA